MENCIFCKIIKDELPTTKIYEDEKFFALLDIRPVSDGHILIIPKEHIVWMQESNDEIISGIFVLAAKLMRGQKIALQCDYVNVTVMGEEVPHFHIHLIPRYLKDGLAHWPTKTYKNDEHKEEVVQKIIQAL